MIRPVCVLIGAVSLYALPVGAAPITTDTALPVAAEEFIARSQVIYSNSSGGVVDARSVVWENVLGYGVSANWALFGVVPTAFTSVDPGAGLAEDLNGIGDVSLFARYTAYKLNGQGYTFRVAPFAGVELPTGRSGIGSQSTDPFAGLVVTYLNNDFEIDLSARYQVNTPSEGLNRRDTLNIDGSLQYRVLPRRLGSGVPRFLYAVGEVNYVRTDAGETTNGPRETLFLTPGLQLVAPTYIVEGAMQIPVHHTRAPGTLEPDFTARFGIRTPF